MMKRRTIFISDLHLQENDQAPLILFKNLLSSCCNYKIDQLFILGDLFEFWIGDDQKTPFVLDVINALKNASQNGLSIYFLCGNRDFFIGEKFIELTGIKHIHEPYVMNLYGENILLMHGDTLCVKDISYQRMRIIIQHPWVKKLFLSLPLNWRKYITKKIRKKSVNYTKKASSVILDACQEAVIKEMLSANTQFLVHGHTHRPAIHSFKVNEKTYQRIVLGAWEETAQILIWHENQAFELKTISNKTNFRDLMVDM